MVLRYWFAVLLAACLMTPLTAQEPEQTAPAGEQSAPQEQETGPKFPRATEDQRVLALELDGFQEWVPALKNFEKENLQVLAQAIESLTKVAAERAVEAPPAEMRQWREAIYHARMLVNDLVSDTLYQRLARDAQLSSTLTQHPERVEALTQLLTKAEELLVGGVGEQEAGVKLLADAHKQRLISRHEALKKTDWYAWRGIPVLHQGRVKPLDSYSEESVTLVAGRSHWTDPLTELKYEPYELTLLWITDEHNEWASRPVIRCEFRELRKLLDSRDVQGEHSEAVQGDAATLAVGTLQHKDVVPGSLTGTVIIDGQPVAEFEVNSAGAFVFSPAGEPQPVADIPVFRQIAGEFNRGWYGSVIRDSFTEQPQNLPVAGSYDAETGHVNLTWNEAPGGEIHCVFNYRYQRNILPEKGTYVALTDVFDWENSQQGQPVYWSQELQRRLEEIRKAGMKDRQPGQVGATSADRELNVKVNELSEHIGAFLGVYRGNDLRIAPGLDPRALQKQEDPDARVATWVSLGAILQPEQALAGGDITIAALTAESPMQLLMLPGEGKYPLELFLQLAQAQTFKHELRPELDAVRQSLYAARHAYHVADAQALSKGLQTLRANITALAEDLTAHREKMGPVKNPESFVVRNDQQRFIAIARQLVKIKKLMEDPALMEGAHAEALLAMQQEQSTQLLLGQPEALLEQAEQNRQPPAGTLELLQGESDKLLRQLVLFKPAVLQSKDFPVPLMDFGAMSDRVIAAYQPVELHEQQLAQSDYPFPGTEAAEQLETELTYNDSQPFQYAWIWFLVASLIVVFSLMVRKEKLVYVLGLVATFAAIAYSAWGFYLRIVIANRPPVTNMYETVIWVAFTVAVLGYIFCLLPVIGPGYNWAWRLTSLPVRVKRGETGSIQGLQLDEPTGEDRQRMLAGAITPIQMAFSAGVLALLGYLVWYMTNSGTSFQVTTLLPPLGQKAFSFGKLATWLVGITTVVIGCWFVARTAFTLVASLFTVGPECARQESEETWGKLLARRWFLLGALPVACLGMMLAYFVGIQNPDILNPRIGSIAAVLRNNYWLTIHVLTIVSSYGAGALAWGLGNIAMCYYIFGRYHRERSSTQALTGLAQAGHVPAGVDEDADTVWSRLRKTAGALSPGKFKETMAAGFSGFGTGDEHLETSRVRPPKEVSTLASYGYKAMQVAVLLLTIGTILGGLWADVSWGRFWDWDPKEVWALISLLLYLVFLHGRFAGWTGTFGTNAASVLCFNAILMSWYGVNFVLPKIPGWLDGTGGTTSVGLHSYASGESSGLEYVGAAFVLNFVVVLVALARYAVETRQNVDAQISSGSEAVRGELPASSTV